MIPKKTKEERKAEKEQRKTLKKKVAKKKVSKKSPVKKPKMTNEKKKLRSIFNEYIRVRDSIKTTRAPFFCRCCTCRAIIANKDARLHAGHFIKSTHNTVTFNEENVHGQCCKCNTFEGGREAEYSGFIINNYGMNKFEWFLAQKGMTKQFKAYELIEMQHKYYEKLLKLVENFPDYEIKSRKPSKLVKL